MLENGKHVLCEKPIALSKVEAVELYELASRKNLVLMEAVKNSILSGFLMSLSILQEAAK